MNALIIIDMQYDFLPGGALAVPEGNLIIQPIRNLRDKFKTVLFTQDWHPVNHCSFKVNGGIWPVHSVQNTHGAKIDKEIIRNEDIIIQKGIHEDVDSYSGFWDNEKRHATNLNTILKEKNVRTLYLCGLATDYCVKYTALDAIDAGYETILIQDACKGVNVNPGDTQRALFEMSKKGVKLITHQKILEGGNV